MILFMKEIKKVSDIGPEDVADYLRLGSLSSGETNSLNMMISAAKAYISGYTGHAVDKLDDYQDFVIVVFIICQDMYDNRTLYVEKANVNRVVETILGMHSVNLL